MESHAHTRPRFTIVARLVLMAAIGVASVVLVSVAAGEIRGLIGQFTY
ncbi:hypothetical protein [Actinoplanes sp. ATCC 53533]|nr:hypothetical protein [Actinoplanes sp. ATCC 53533]